MALASCRLFRLRTGKAATTSRAPILNGGVMYIRATNMASRRTKHFAHGSLVSTSRGMIAAIHGLTGRRPRHYFGDTHDPARPQVRDLKQEALRVFRSRVVNPKW